MLQFYSMVDFLPQTKIPLKCYRVNKLQSHLSSACLYLGFIYVTYYVFVHWFIPWFYVCHILCVLSIGLLLNEYYSKDPRKGNVLVLVASTVSPELGPAQLASWKTTVHQAGRLTSNFTVSLRGPQTSQSISSPGKVIFLSVSIGNL